MNKQQILDQFEELQEAIEDSLSSSRERAVAITNLQTAKLWVQEAMYLQDTE
jgi:hypothetical protein